ncbi:MAG: PQQ-binding-like beta-propeller repeat protein, partial [Candidatus Hydrogenedentes bacterium]|nr:PQQ-binding-like beta-propeller repeat protein [Candidatus Hydrogenedentota bacterium]
MRANRLIAGLAVAVALLQPADAADWPMWRFDAGRTAASPAGLPDDLNRLWTHEFSPREPVWDDPLNRDLMPYDTQFEPIVMGSLLFLGFNDRDKLVAIDTATGEERWALYTDGPIRMVPAAWNGTVLAACDDGYLYCVEADTGAVRWKFRGGPSDRKVLGNRRLISTWPARGGPVVVDGTVYFAASIWPFMGTFIYALDAQSGAVVWRNDRTSAQWINQPHQNPAFAGVAPQGAFVVSEDRLLVPGGRSVACCFHRDTGDFAYYHLADYGKSGGSFVCAGGGVYFNHHRDQIVTMYDLAGGREIAAQVGRLPVVTDSAFITSGESVAAFDIQRVRDKPKEWRERALLWQAAVDASGDLIKAGNRFYAGGAGRITAFAPPAGDGEPAIAWTKDVDGRVVRLLAADDKLFAVTHDGHVMAFGAGPADPKNYSQEPAPPPADAEADAAATAILDATGVREGYALVYGLGDGRLAEAVARNSDLCLIAIDPDPAKVDEARRRLDAAGLPAARLAVLPGDPFSIELPPYMASLSIIADLEAARYAPAPEFLERIFSPMRPYGGAAWLPLSGAGRDAFVRLAGASQLHGVRAEAVGDAGVLLTREGPLPGAGTWTHQYGNPANTVKSDDDLVRMPLGLLWFGGNPNTDVLPRHGHGPPEQILGGRLFIEGMERISARDVYTGRVLWRTQLGDLGSFGVYFDQTYKDTPTSTAYNQVHIPGANARGTNFVATPDKVYVLQGPVCHVLDAATGAKLGTLSPPAKRRQESADLGYLGVQDDTLVCGVGFVPFSQLPPEGNLDIKEQKAYAEFVRYDKTASRELVAMDRHTGEVKWRIGAQHGFIHNGTALSKDTLFTLDKLPPYIEQFYRRRGKRTPSNYRLIAVDLHTGDVKWDTSDDVFGTWLGYSAEHGLLLQATRPSSDMVEGESGKQMIVYRAGTGEVVWNIRRGYGNPPMIHGDRIITHRTMYSLVTGEQITRTNPLTGN